MGLAGRKIKQRIGADPRNLSWVDDASRFGSTYLAKFGWDSSKGLGVTGDGRTSHIKVSHKLDMLGIGAANVHDPNGIAWKQNRDFENLLRRLNDENENEDEDRDSRKKKKKKSEVEDGKKRNKKDKEHKSKKSKGNKSEESAPKALETSAPTPIIPRHRAHRARAIAAKKMLSGSATAISEILGIAPTSSESVTPDGELTTLDDDVTAKITTSSKSVADYFKEKLLSRTSGSSTSKSDIDDDAFDKPRGGIGSRRNVNSVM
ncbi:hypothetical protein F5887DRAFT_880525 [Amanita rubescens]|nr:hypothetical protein F5887DRAFT_880525 [Amanita rubescens]